VFDVLTLDLTESMVWLSVSLVGSRRVPF